MKSASRSASKAVRTLSPIRSISKDEESPGTTKAERTFSTGSRRRRTRPRGAAPPHLPDSELTEEEFVKEWGITKDQEVRGKLCIYTEFMKFFLLGLLLSRLLPHRPL